MKSFNPAFVDQTTFGYGRGNCWSACIASLLGLPVEDVPNFCSDEHVGQHGNWLLATQKWLAELGFGCLLLDLTILPDGCIPHHLSGWVIASGRSSRWTEDEPLDHCVVCRVSRDAKGELWWEWAHDPHPSREWIAGPVKDVFVITVPAPPGQPGEPEEPAMHRLISPA